MIRVRNNGYETQTYIIFFSFLELLLIRIFSKFKILFDKQIFIYRLNNGYFFFNYLKIM